MRARELGIAAAAALAIAVVLTWPLAAGMGTRLPYDPRFVSAAGADTHVWVWNLWWAREALATGSDPFFCPLIFHPNGHTLALHTHTLLWGLVSVPLQHAFGLPFAYNALLLILLAAAATATFALARAIGLGRGGAALAAFAWAFSPYFLQKGLEHLNLFASPWPPLFGLACLRWCGAHEPGRARSAALAAGTVLGLSLLTSLVASFYTLIFGALLLALRPSNSVEHARARARGLGFPTAWLLGAGAAFLVSWPWLAALSANWSSLSGAAGREQLYHPELVDFVTPPGLHPAFTGLGAGAPRAEAAWKGARNEDAGLYAGASVLTLALLGFLLVPRARRWAVLALFLFLLAWDPGPDPHGFLSNAYRNVSVLELLRVPARAWPFALLPLALVAGMGLDLLLRSGRASRAIAGLLCAALAAEWWVGPYPSTDATAPEAVRAIARAHTDGSVAFLPFTPGAHEAMTWQTVHGEPVLYSYVARSDPRRFLELQAAVPELFALASGVRLPDPLALSIDLQCADVSHVLVDRRQLLRPELMTRVLDEMRGWERASTGDHVEWWYDTSRLSRADDLLDGVRREE